MHSGFVTLPPREIAKDLAALPLTLGAQRLCRTASKRDCSLALQSTSARLRWGFSQSAMASGSTKRRRISGEALHRILHVGGASISGLFALLTKLRSEDADVLHAKHWELRAARDSLFSGLRLAIELPRSSGGDVLVWEMLDPLKLLPQIIERRSDVRSLFTAAARRSPPSAERPWHLVIGFDGFTPGFSLANACVLKLSRGLENAWLGQASPT